jgi:hypothetical protein
MTYSTSRTINSLMDRPKSGTSPWTGLLLALFCGALLLPGCGGGAGPSKLDRELKALESDTASERETALLHLVNLPDGAEGAPKAVGLLKDTEKGVRSAAISLIAKSEHKTPEALAALSAVATGDADTDVAQFAMDTLLALGAAKEHVKAAQAHLASDDGAKRCAGANSISEASAESIATLEKELATALTDKDDCVREYSALALEKLGDKASAETKAALAAAKKN